MAAREEADGLLSLPHLENAALIYFTSFWVSGLLSFLEKKSFFNRYFFLFKVSDRDRKQK